MRKLKLQVQLTVDGFVAGPKGEMDWLVWDWDENLKNYVRDLTDPVDTVVLGRKLAEGFIPHWAGVAADPADPQQAAGQKFTDTPKVVFTKTLQTSPWRNTVLATGDLAEEIASLKNQEGGDIIAYGGAEFVSSLIQNDLIDDYHLFINPAVIGRGLTIFSSLEQKQKLTLVKAAAFPCGIVVLHYQAQKS